MASIITRYDDRDPSIQYSGIWGTAGTSLDYLNTTTFTIYAGSAVSFNFTGTGVSVYGRIGPTGFGYAPLSNYTIDSGAPYTFNGTQKTDDQHQQLFFRATGLGLGQHTLAISNVLQNDVLTLDFLEVETTGDASSSSSTTMPISTATTTQSATAIQTSTSTTRVRPPIGTAIGGAIAGALTISLILFACFFVRRRRRRHHDRQEKNVPPDSLSSPQQDMSSASNITPFVIGDGSLTGTSSLGEYVTSRGYGYGHDDGGSSVVGQHGTQVPFFAGGRLGEKGRGGELPPRYTASSDVR